MGKGKSVQADKDRQALELRKAGNTYSSIALQMGYANEGGAYKAVMRALNASIAIRNKVAEDVLELELGRLDDMLVGLWGAAAHGQWLAVDRVLAIMDRRARYLGLDSPTKQEITGRDGQAIQIEQDVTYSVEERDRRIIEIVDAARERSHHAALPAGPDLDSPTGSPDASVA